MNWTACCLGLLSPLLYQPLNFQRLIDRTAPWLRLLSPLLHQRQYQRQLRFLHQHQRQCQLRSPIAMGLRSEVAKSIWFLNFKKLPRHSLLHKLR